MSNPWLSLWLSAANSWSGALRGFWTAELQRQQMALLKAATEQSARFWGGAWRASLDLTPPAKRRRQ